MHEFTVWAPHALKVAVKIGEATYPMRGPSDRGWWSAAVEEAGAGTDYGFVLDEDAIAVARSSLAMAAEWSAWRVAGV